MLVKIYPDNPNYKQLGEVVEALRRGEVIIYPTSTGYAYCCDALQSRSVEHICELKGIDPKKKALSLMFLGLSEVSEYCRVSNTAFQFIKGQTEPCTFILPASNSLPKIYKHRKEVGVRLVEHPIGRLLLQELGNPLIVSSLPVDPEDPEYVQHPELVYERFGTQVSFVIDGGIVGEGGSSRVINCVVEPFEVIRE